MEYVLKTKRIRKKTKHWREFGKFSGMRGKKFMSPDTLDLMKRRK